LGSCAKPYPVDQGILSEIESATRSKATQPDTVRDALLPPLRAEMPKAAGAPVEPRFDFVVNAAPARQVFMSMVSGTRYSMVVNPAVSGTLSLSLKDVTVREALEAIREAYGHEFRIDGTRIYVEAAGLQTRVFQVNYLVGLRSGRSDVRVSAGATTGTEQAGGGGGAATAAPQTGGAPGQSGSAALSALGLGSIATQSLDATRVSMVSQSDLWNEVTIALRTLIGTGAGRNVVVSPQSGVIVVRAMPEELRGVEKYLRAMRLSVERQVMIEAKVIEVTLNDQYQAGINWAAFSGRGLSVGQVSQGTLLQNTGPGGVSSGVVTGAGSITGTAGAYTVTGPTVGSFPGSDLINFTNPAASLFGLAFQNNNFAALLTFLESQGSTQVLSSPRVATLNNQKAVLKVGTDQFFVTAITGTPITNTLGVITAVQLTPTFNSFFSGVSLDITPQIDEDGNILLHIHPRVSDVQNSPVQFNFGVGGTQDIPLAKTAVNETDTLVRARDGTIVALGGLMQVEVVNEKSGIPGLQDIPLLGNAFRSTTRRTVKKELVILLKPTVIKSDKDWEQDIQQAHDRIQRLGSGAGRPQREGTK
jgi:MSHA biogenesis protein MshL